MMLGLCLLPSVLNFAKKKERVIDPRCYSDIKDLADIIKGMIRNNQVPKVGIICGSGFGDIGDRIQEFEIVPYSKIPGFPKATVKGHKGNLIFGYIGKQYVVCLQGRFHPYEHDMNLALCALPVRVMHHLGVQILLISNAVGGIHPDFRVGDFMIMKDHIFMPGLVGFSPLVGLHGDCWGPKFPSLYNQYDAKLRELALGIAKQHNIRMHEGIYVMCGGPQYESYSEIQFLKMAGADAVGMSTCHEVVVARQCGMKVVAISLISNIAGGKSESTHEDVLRAGERASKDAWKFVQAFLQNLEHMT